MPTRTAPLGVAVVGLGVGEQHARAFAARDGCRLLYVHDLDASKAKRLAAELRIRTTSDFESLLRDPEVHAVSIASFDDAHALQVEAALLAGRHVFVEKPLCRSSEELRRIERAWSRGGKRHLASNLVLRAAPLYRWLREAVSSGEMGRIYAFDGDYLYGRVEKITDGWRKDVEDYSVLQGGGIHLVDLMLSVAGERPESVTTVGNGFCTEKTAFRYDDFVAAMYRFPSGLVGRITANFGCVHPHQHVVRVFGTKATFIYDDQGARLQTSRTPDHRPIRLAHAPQPASKGALIPDFVAAVLAAPAAASGARREFDTIAACLAADRALSSGRTEKIQYL